MRGIIRHGIAESGFVWLVDERFVYANMAEQRYRPALIVRSVPLSCQKQPMAKKKSVPTKSESPHDASAVNSESVPDVSSDNAAGVNEERPSAVDFEASLAEIEKIVSQLEAGDLGLADSLEQYAQAIHRLKECHGLLQHAERRISLLSGFDADGNPLTEPLEDGEADSLEAKQQARGRRRGAKQGKTPASGRSGGAGSADRGGSRDQVDSRDQPVSRGDADEQASVDDSPGLF